MCVEVVEVSYFYDQNSSHNVSRTTHKFSENKENIILQPLQIDSESRILEEEEFFKCPSKILVGIRNSARLMSRIL